MSFDIDLTGTLHRTVAERLSEHLRTIDDNGPLSLDDERALTRSLIAAELRRLAEELGWAIATKSDGNPFFVFEIVESLREGRYLTKEPGGTWVSTTRIWEPARGSR